MSKKYFQDSRMTTTPSESVSTEDFLQSIDEAEREIFEFLLEYANDSSDFPYLVRGAVLQCDYGSHSRKLNLPICHGVYATVHPMVHELDCEVGDDKNIPTFGVCGSSKHPQDKFMGETVLLVSEDDPSKNVKGCPCTPVIVGGRWLNPHPTTKIAENNAAARWMNPANRTYHSALTTDSFLVCAYGGLIEPLTSGQENIETQGVDSNNIYNPHTGANPSPPNFQPLLAERDAWLSAQNSNLSRDEKIALLSAFYGFPLGGDLLSELEKLYGPLVDSSRSFFNKTYLMNINESPTPEMLQERAAIKMFEEEIKKLLGKQSSAFLNSAKYFSNDTRYNILKQLHEINQQKHKNNEDYVNSIIGLINLSPDVMEVIKGYADDGWLGLGDALANIIVDSTHMPDLVGKYTASPSQALKESEQIMAFFGLNKEYQYLMKNQNTANSFASLIDARIKQINSSSTYSAYERQVITSMLSEVRDLNLNHADSLAIMQRRIEQWKRFAR